MSEKMTYEQKIDRINEIISMLSDPAAELDRTVEMYGEAVGLLGECRKLLDEAEVKVTELTASLEGEETT